MWLRVARCCYRLQFACADLGEWCYARYLSAKRRRGVSE